MVKTLVGPNFNYGHHSIRLCLVVIAFLSVLSRKRCGAKSGLVVLVTTSPKLYLPTFCARKYSSYRHKSRLCMRKEHNITTPKIQRTMVSTRRSPEKEPPRRRPLDLSRRGQLRARQEREERRRRRMEASVVWKIIEIDLSRNNGFFGDGLSGLKIFWREIPNVSF